MMTWGGRTHAAVLTVSIVTVAIVVTVTAAGVTGTVVPPPQAVVTVATAGRPAQD